MVRTLSGVVLWSLAALGIWLLTLSALSWGELLVGAGCSVVVGVIALAAQRAVGTSWKTNMASLRPLVALPFAIGADTMQVLTVPLRHRGRHGAQFETMDIGAAGSSPQAVTRRALATFGTTVTPASIVVDVDEDGVMTLHRLPTRGLRMEEGFKKR
jgi:multisubunit Na+/H+ antiporter MnhE subunit